MRTTLYMLVGLPGSGKSTLAKDISKLHINSKHISSDSLRLELFGNEEDRENNYIIFNEMKKRTKDCLNSGINVIYDATNISSKKRISFLKELKKINCKKICIYVATPFEKCIENNIKRERKVDIDAILKMYKSLQVPAYYEGWDDIIIHCNESKKYNKCIFNLANNISYETYCNDILRYAAKECIDLAQDNPYHTLSVSRHMYQTFLNLKNKTNNAELIIAALLHDIGKPFCKNFKEGSMFANFYGHDNVSAQMALVYLYKIGINTDIILDIVQYIQLHMQLLNIKDNEKGLLKLKNKIGDIIFDNLLLLHEADIAAT